MAEQEIKTMPMWKQELRLRNMGFRHGNPCQFVEPQCGSPSFLFILWRAIAFIYFFGVLLYGATTYEYGVKWLIFLSNWSYLLLVITTMLQLICAVYHYHQHLIRRQTKENPYSKMPYVWRVVWFLHTLQLVSSPIITVGYWIVLYRGQWDMSLYNITTHGINAAYVFLDLWISGAPVRILHFYIPLIYGGSYAVFTYIYFRAGGTDELGNTTLYRYLDYEHYPGYSAGIIVGMIFISTVIHMLIFALFRLRRSMHKRVCCGPCQSHHDQYPAPCEESESEDESTEDYVTTNNINRTAGQQRISRDSKRSNKTEQERPGTITYVPYMAGGGTYGPQGGGSVIYNQTVGGAMGGSVGGAMGMPMGGAMSVPMGGAMSVPVGGAMAVPMGRVVSVPVGGAIGIPVGLSMGGSVGGASGAAMGGAMPAQVGGAYQTHNNITTAPGSLLGEPSNSAFKYSTQIGRTVPFVISDGIIGRPPQSPVRSPLQNIVQVHAQ